MISAYLRTLEHSLQTIEEIVTFNNEHADIELPEGKVIFIEYIIWEPRNPTLMHAIDYPNQAHILNTLNDTTIDEESEKAKAELRSITLDGSLNDALQRYPVDAIIGPIDSPIPCVAACAGSCSLGGLACGG